MIRLQILMFVTFLLAACGDAGIVANRTDSNGLVRYAMPDGWTNTNISSGDHYKRVDVEKSPVLAVVARQRSSVPTIQQVQEGTKGKHEAQRHTLTKESSRTQNNFTVWEAVYVATLRGQEVIFHDVYLFSDALQVEVSLNASRQDHEKFEPNLQSVVASVRANTAD